MKLGEIKVETLKIMFASTHTDLSIGELDNALQDESYGGYLVNMPGAINRCFSVLEEKRVLPVKAYTLTSSVGLASGSFMRFDLPKIIEDYFDVQRIVCMKCDEYIGDYEYQKEGDTLVIEGFDENNTYTLLYYPKIPRISSLTSNEEEVGVPENIAAHIPYFVKGDLYRDDEPNEASEARNWFEAAMEGIMRSRANKASKVASVFSQTEL